MKLKATLFLMVFVFLPQPLFASDNEQLIQLLNNFLDGADRVEQHNRFWAEDLIYTSSAGSRFGKAEIMAGFSSPAPDEASKSGESDEESLVQSYSAENVDIRLFGSTAIVAFKLVGSSTDKGVQSTTYYFNTGTFVKRAGQWQAVAWQATKIPEGE